MNDATANNLQRLHDLLSEQATAGLSDSDQLELQKLLHDNASLQREGYELAAAAVDLALCPPDGVLLPDRVRRGALMKSTMEAEPEPEVEPVVYQLTEEKPIALKRVASTPVAPQTIDVISTETSLPVEKPGKTGVLIAFALIGVAFLTYTVGRSGGVKRNQAPAGATVAQTATPISCDAIKAAADKLTIPWSESDPTLGEVTGEVRFSAKLQQGCLVLTGLPRLDPAQAVYQLWIIDSDRQGPPVDAGLFEVTGSVTAAETIVFTPKLKVSSPIVFAITREPPGGVVTSKNQPIVLAKVRS